MRNKLDIRHFHPIGSKMNILARKYAFNDHYCYYFCLIDTDSDRITRN
jgi:hypothetical protein